MSRPYQFSEEDKITSPLDRQPANPLPPAQSFRPNVNRAKTKKWVEAKQYSYEGDDWGDYDDEDEYGVSGPSQPLSVNTAAPKQQPGTRSVTSPLSSTMPSQQPRRPPSFDAGDERRTFSAGFSQPPSATTSLPREQPLQLNTGIPPIANVPTLSSPNMRSPIGDISSAVSHQPHEQPAAEENAGPKIIRPADIYKRMLEEREKTNVATPTSSNKPAESVEPVATTAGDSAKVHPPSGIASTVDPGLAKATAHEPALSASQRSIFPSKTQPRVSLPPQLPNVAADSAFGDDFWGPSTAPPKPAVNAPTAPQTQLEHTPSTGLRSMVNRAFDEPVAGSTGVHKQDSQRSAAASSVSRTDTGTSDISPIISPISAPTVHGIPANSAGAAGSSSAANRASDSTIRAPQVPAKDAPILAQAGSSGFTPGLGSSQQLPQPEVTKLGLANSGGIDTGLTLPAQNDMAGREADLAAVARGVPEKSLPALATSELNAQQSFLNKEPPLPADMSPRIQRAESPTKGRVADLTQRFAAGSRRGSDDSLQSWERNSAPPSPTKDAAASFTVPKSPTKNLAVTRPSAEREASFRPKLPGQWESYANSTASASSENVTHQEPLALNTAAAASSSMPKSQPDADVELTPTTRKHSLPSQDVQITPQPTPSGGAHPISPMVALTAAGASLGGAFNQSHGPHTDTTPRAPARAYGDIAQRPVMFGRLDSDSDVTTALPTPLPEDHTAGAGVHPTVEPTTPKASQISHQPQTPKNVHAPQMNVEDSPSDLESDRLRKEIVRSLSPTQSPAAGHNDALLAAAGSSAATERPQSSVIPSEYDSYWNDSSPQRNATAPSAPVVAQTSNPAVAEKSESRAVIPPIPTTTNMMSAPAAEASTPQAATQTGPHPGPLARRFSWEDETPPANSSALPLGLAASKNAGEPAQPQKALPSHVLAADNSRLSMGGLQVVNADVDDIPDTPVETPAASREIVPGSIMDSTNSAAPLSPHDLPSKPLPIPNAGTATRGVTGVPTDPKLPAFREIMAMKSPQQRIETFNSTRDAWAKHDSGLGNWVQSTIESNHEHRHLLDGQLFTAPTDSFTPRHRANTSLGNIFAKPTQDSPSQSSYMTASHEKTSPAQQKNTSVGAIKGKELLQTAGVLGGKGLSGAKGLFAKGKLKLKAAGGNDKVDD